MMTESKADFFDTDEFADEVTYIPNGGLPVVIEAIIDDDYPNQQDFDRGGADKFAVALLHVHSTDVTAPSSRDQFTFHDYTWQISPEGYQRSGDFYRVNLIREL